MVAVTFAAIAAEHFSAIHFWVTRSRCEGILNAATAAFAHPDSLTPDVAKQEMRMLQKLSTSSFAVSHKASLQ